ncbi:MAG TPA: sulfotransferase [Anaerolineales bacterium]|nr:sulfotransferase [Anaerolineales bacterium]
MIATSFEITAKRRAAPFALANVKDFDLRESGHMSAEDILSNVHITLYALDFESGRAVFVETAPETDLSQAPFYYQAQYENALCVITLSFEETIRLAQSLTVDDSKLIVIHSMGRCGSTLASKILAQIPGVNNISEPDALTQLVAARSMQPDKQLELKMLLEASIRLLCKTPVQTAWVIKGRSWVIHLADWLHEFYPRTKNLYLYRDADAWIKSNVSAFVDETRLSAEQLLQYEDEVRGWMQFLVRSIARYDPNQHLSSTGLLSLGWLDNMERYMELHQAGIAMLAIPYSSWKRDAPRTAISMLDYCGCRPDDLTAIEETLAKDSQAGSAASQDNVKQKKIGVELFDPAELERHLHAHAYIRTADFEVANTLKL